MTKRPFLQDPWSGMMFLRENDRHIAYFVSYESIDLLPPARHRSFPPLHGNPTSVHLNAYIFYPVYQ